MMREFHKNPEAGESGKAKKQTWMNLPAAALHWLTEPGAGLPDPERRRAHMLAWLRLTLIFLVSVTLSAGVAIFPQHGANGTEVLAAADAALYQAKLQGRDRVVAANFQEAKKS